MVDHEDSIFEAGIGDDPDSELDEGGADLDDDLDEEGDEPEVDEPEVDEPEGDEPAKHAAGKAGKVDKADKADKSDKADDEPISAWDLKRSLEESLVGPAPERAKFKNDADYTAALLGHHRHQSWIGEVAADLTKPRVYKGITIPPLSARDAKAAVMKAAALMKDISPESLSLILRFDAALRSAKAEGSKVVTTEAAAPRRPKAEKPTRGRSDAGAKPARQSGAGQNKSVMDHEERAKLMFGTAYNNPFTPR